MIPMVRFLLLLAALVAFQAPAYGQDSTGDRDFLVAFLEDRLSGAGREIRIEGFQGALSGKASLDRLTIADARGVWLTLTGAVLDWDRFALLRGRLEVTELSAQVLNLARRPITTAPPPADPFRIPDLPSPVSSGFALPDLPVSVRVGAFRIDELILGIEPLAQPAVFAAEGSGEISGGSGKAALSVRRIDGPAGEIAAAFSFERETKTLEFKVEASEGRGGVAATLLGVPEAPAMDLVLAGIGAGEAVSVDLALSSQGVPRLFGQFGYGAGQAGKDGTEQAIWARLNGDPRPLVSPDYAAFLGEDVMLDLRGAKEAGGGLRIDAFDLSTGAMKLTGEMLLGSDLVPLRIEAAGEIRPVGAEDVLLALPGPRLWVRKTLLDLSFDASLGDQWSTRMESEGLRTDTLAVGAWSLSGNGRIAQGTQGQPARIAGTLALSASGIAGANPLSVAFGPSLEAGLRFDKAEGSPFVLEDVSIVGPDFNAAGSLQVSLRSESHAAFAEGGATLVADDLSRFSTLVGQTLGGSAVIDVGFFARASDGTTDIRMAGQAKDMKVGIPSIDRLLPGASTIELNGQRGPDGTRIENLVLENRQIILRGKADLQSSNATGEVRVNVTDASALSDRMTGPAELSASLVADGPEFGIRVTASGPGGAEGRFDGSGTLADNRFVRLEGELSARVSDLSQYSEIAGRTLGGAAEASGHARGSPQTGRYAFSLEGLTTDARLGQPEADRLLRGEVSIAAAASGDLEGNFELENLEFSGPAARGQASGYLGASHGSFAFDIGVADLGVLAPGISGPSSAAGTARREDGQWRLDVRGSGPGGTTAVVDGTISGDLAQADLAVAGVAPIALANRFIAPNLASGQIAYDLNLKGPLVPTSISGTARTGDARLITGDQVFSVTDGRAVVRLSNGRGTIEGQAKVNDKGAVGATGKFSIQQPYDFDLALDLAAVPISDRGLFETVVSGALTARGSSVSSSFGGSIVLGSTEIRLSESPPASAARLTGIRHINDSPSARLSRSRAGLNGQDGAGPSAEFPIDLRISAPSRIFLRGRGLDAEMGGALRVGGTTAALVPQGRFELIRGRFDFLGKRLALTEGFAQLRGTFDPYFLVAAESTAADVDIRVEIEGIGPDITVRLTSSPELPEDEILARFLFGRSLAEISAVQALRMAAAARTLGGGGAGIADRLRQTVGLDDLDIRATDTGATEVRAGKYISDNIYTDVGVDSEGRSNARINLFINRSLTARGKVDNSGDSSIGLFFERDY